jgi:hypothetical protein
MFRKWWWCCNAITASHVIRVAGGGGGAILVIKEVLLADVQWRNNCVTGTATITEAVAEEVGGAVAVMCWKRRFRWFRNCNFEIS